MASRSLVRVCPVHPHGPGQLGKERSLSRIACALSLRRSCCDIADAILCARCPVRPRLQPREKDVRQGSMLLASPPWHAERVWDFPPDSLRRVAGRQDALPGAASQLSSGLGCNSFRVK